MAHIIFISGGARSGKSRLAEERAIGYGAPVVYLATGSGGDAEMVARIERHRARRGPAWVTVEEPLDLAGTIAANAPNCKAILVDCVTLWLTNLLLTYEDAQRALREVAMLTEFAASVQIPLILVSNEVGMGIVPDNALARTFRDLAGEANELLAAAADEVYVMFSGLPLKLR